MPSILCRTLIVVLAVLALEVSPAVAARQERTFRGHFARFHRARWRPAGHQTIAQMLAAANASYDRDEYDDAARQFAAILRIQSRNIDALVGLGNVLRVLGRLDESLTTYQTAVLLAPQDAKVYCGRGAVYAQKHQYELAMADYEKALRINPKYGAAYRFRGWTFDNQGNWERAIQDDNRALELNPQDAWAFFGRSKAHYHSGNLDRALADASRAVSLAPRESKFIYLRACCYWKKHELQKSLADTTEAIRLKPQEPCYYTFRDDLYFDLKEVDKAIDDASTAIRLDPQYASAYRDRGYYLETKGDLRRAISDFSEAIHFDPKHARTIAARGWAYSQVRELDNALADANAALQLEPDNANFYRLRGGIFDAKDDQASAKRDFVRFRQIELPKLFAEMAIPRARQQPKAAFEALEKRIKAFVKSLDYDDELAAGLSTMVRDWDLVALAAELETARVRHARGDLSMARLVEAEQRAAKRLARIINALICPTYSPLCGHELSDVVYGNVACCEGTALLYFVLGNSIGLSTEGLEVTTLADGPTAQSNGHVANLVRLADESTVIVDATGNLSHGALTSDAFRFDAAYSPCGKYWSLKNHANPLGIHQVVRPADAKLLVAQLLAFRASEKGASGKYDAAIEEIAEALRLDPRSAFAIHHRGAIHSLKHQFDKAVVDYSEAIAINPANSFPLALRGRCYMELKNVDLAAVDFDKAIGLNPRFVFALVCRGKLYFAKDALQKALADFQSAESADENDADAHLNCGMTWLKLAGQDEDRHQAFLSEESLSRRELREHSEILQTGMVSKALPSGSSGATLSDRDAKTDDPNEPSDFCRIADEEYCAKVRADVEKATAEISIAIRLDPKNDYAYQLRAGIEWMDHRKCDEAIADYTAAIQINPQDAIYRIYRGKIYAYKGCLDKALADFNEAIRLAPTSPEAYTARGDLYSQRHEAKKATADYAEARRLQPSDDRYR